MNYKKKGFTLIELMIVIVIIGVLTAVLVPSWMNYIKKSRLQTQNNNSRVIFNAAQNIVQEYRFSERKLADADKMIGSNDFYFYWDGENGVVVDEDGNDVNIGGGSSKSVEQVAFEEEFAEKINNIYDNSDSSVYKIYIEDYIVKSVASGRTDVDLYLGSYPEKTTDTRADTETVIGYDMDKAVLSAT